MVRLHLFILRAVAQAMDCALLLQPCGESSRVSLLVLSFTPVVRASVGQMRAGCRRSRLGRVHLAPLFPCACVDLHAYERGHRAALEPKSSLQLLRSPRLKH